MKSDRHYYIVNYNTDQVLAPAVINDRDPGSYGMAADIDIYQYGRKKLLEQFMPSKYHHSFKWMIETHKDRFGRTQVTFNNKWSGMYLAVKEDSLEAGARLCQAKEGSIYWHVDMAMASGADIVSYRISSERSGGGVYSTGNGETVVTQEMTISDNTSGFPGSEWMLVEASALESGVNAIEVSTFHLAEDIRDNNWFKLAVPDPHDIPEVGNTAFNKIDAIGKMLGVFPDQNKFEELYNALVNAMEQIVEQALVKNELDNLIGNWNEAHIILDAHQGEKPEAQLKALQDAEALYEQMIGRLMVEDIKEAGLVLFMQAASAHLATIISMESLTMESRKQGLTNMATQYAAHVQQTFKEMKRKRMELLTEKDKRFRVFTDPFYTDTYQRSRIAHNGDLYDYDTYRHWMDIHFDVEFGDPVAVAQSWTDQAEQWRQAMGLHQI